MNAASLRLLAKYKQAPKVGREEATRRLQPKGKAQSSTLELGKEPRGCPAPTLAWNLT